MAGPTRLLHLVGSTDESLLGDLSLHYAASCLEAIADDGRYASTIAHVSPGGRWRFPAGVDPDEIAATPDHDVPDAITRLADLGVDLVVPQMFCLSGMTDHRALLHLLDLPYVGNTPEVMALTADKARAKAVAAAAGITVPDGQVLHRGEAPSLAPPVVVKPLAGDNSVGMALVRTADDYPTALADAWAHGPALVETFVPPGREVRAGTLETPAGVVALPPEEYAVDPVHRPVRDRRAKFTRDDDGTVHLTAKGPAMSWMLDPDDPVRPMVEDLGLRLHRALGCRHYGLFDLRIDPDGRPWFLEAGLYCSFAPQSVVCTMARAAGIALPDLFASLVDLALADRPRR